MKNFKQLALTVATSLLFAVATQAQVKVGDNPTTINANSMLEVESTNKGFLFPRVALTATNAAAPLSAMVAGMTVYNTATTGTAPNNVVPGIYTSNGTVWVKNSGTANAGYSTMQRGGIRTAFDVGGNDVVIGVVSGFVTSAQALKHVNGAAGSVVEVIMPDQGTTDYDVFISVYSDAATTNTLASIYNDFEAPLVYKKTATGFSIYIEELNGVFQSVQLGFLLVK
jgi:hypothetical protein